MPTRMAGVAGDMLAGDVRPFETGATSTKNNHHAMTATIKNNQLHIVIDLQPAKPSASGKTLVVATTGGNQATTATVDGKPVIIGLNAYVKP